MVRWPSWPLTAARKFRVRLVVGGIEWEMGAAVPQRMVVEVNWKGPRATLSSLRRTVRRNRTREEEARKGDAGKEERLQVEWNEEFENVVSLTPCKDTTFYPWEISFNVFDCSDQGRRGKSSAIGATTLNLAEYSSSDEEINVDLPLVFPGIEPSITLRVTLIMTELKLPQVVPELEQAIAEVSMAEKDELSAFRASLRKVKFLKEFVSTRKPKKEFHEESSDGKFSGQSDDAECMHTCDSGNEMEDEDYCSIRKSFSYDTLTSAKFAGGLVYSDLQIDECFDDWVYYSHRKSDVGSRCLHGEESTASVFEPPLSKKSILPWKRRKLTFRASKSKGEPLLKKAYGEDGGDDIDYDRRIISSSDESLAAAKHKDEGELAMDSSAPSDFGDDNFVVGSWEPKEIVCRDGNMKLTTQVFFASIDQRNEQAAGESACTALVAVVADWLLKNPDVMPIRSQLDSLIREGSREWRALRDNAAYREHFQDGHFDIETVMHAKIRPIATLSSKSFVGFFHPEGAKDNDDFDFLHGAMSFDNIWDEISQADSAGCTEHSGGCKVYIVSWNDHFFVLKAEHDAYYIIDSLGERLYEGCNQAYILKFDGSTEIYQIPAEETAPTSSGDQTEAVGSTAEGSRLICKGKESCKEYIKSFLAAIPIRELEADMKKGLMATAAPLHRRLQIEFHYATATQHRNIDVQDADVADGSLPETADKNCELQWPETVEGFTLLPAVEVA